MLKTTVLSLLIGAVALVVVLTRFFGPPLQGEPVQPVCLSEGTASLINAEGTFTAAGLALEPLRVNAGVVLETGGVEATDYPFLHIALENPPRILEIRIAFTVNGKSTDRYTLETPSPTSVWLTMNEFEGWEGNVEAVELTILNLQKDNLLVTDLALHPASSSNQLKAIVTDLASFTPWKRAQMNTHTGVAKVASFYPVPLIVSLLLLSLMAYGLIVLLSRRAFSWSAVGLIFLVCWVGLDLVWQKRLMHQVAHSHHSFAGKTTEQKLTTGPDRRLYRLVSKAKAHIQSPDARIFVASDDLYLGMRGAYYLYPLNPYWRLEGPQLPDGEYLRAGDHVLLIFPTRLWHHRDKGVRRPETRYYPAETLYESRAGRLLRLM